MAARTSLRPSGSRTDRVRYGLTKDIETFNPVKVAFGEYGALARDVRAARGWRTRLEIALRGPGWEPD